MSDDDRIVDLLERAAPVVQVVPDWRQTQRRIRRDRRRHTAVNAAWITLVAVVLIAGISMVVAGQRRGLGVETGGSDATAAPSGPAGPSSSLAGTTTTTLVPRPDDVNLPDVVDVSCTDAGGSVTPRVRNQADGVHFRFHGQVALYWMGDTTGLLGPLKAGVEGINQLTANATYAVSCQLNVNDPNTKHSIGSLTVVDANGVHAPTVDPTCATTYSVSSHIPAPGDVRADVARQLQGLIGQPVDVTLTGYQSSSSPSFTARLDDQVIASGQVDTVIGIQDLSAQVCVDAPHATVPVDVADRAVPSADAAIAAVRSLSGSAPTPPPTELQAKLATPEDILQAAGGAVPPIPSPKGVTEWFVLAEAHPDSWMVYEVDADVAPIGRPTSLALPLVPVAVLPTRPSWWDSVPDHA
jgi:hypothetical protein